MVVFSIYLLLVVALFIYTKKKGDYIDEAGLPPVKGNISLFLSCMILVPIMVVALLKLIFVLGRGLFIKIREKIKGRVTR